MPVMLNLKYGDVSADMLLDIYRKFCKAYEIECGRRDERFMRGPGTDALHNGHLEYRPFYGAKFFGENRGDQTEFWGYTDIEDLNQYKNNEVFQRLVAEPVQS
ncbi:MAG TPA: hypothetical protein VJI12_00835 [archaeon]|nr:hypothetical protein [archaeon]